MKEIKRGDRVSLNTVKRLFFFQDGEGGINLSSGGTEVAIVPENATELHLAQINHAIKAEHLSVGWPEKMTEMADTDSDIKKVLDGGRNKIDEWMFNIRDDKGIKKSDKVSQIERIMAMEKVGKNRKSVVKVAESILGFLGGVSPVEDSEQEKIEIKLTSGNEEIPEGT